MTFNSPIWFKFCLSALLIMGACFQASAQDPLRFQKEIDQIRETNPPSIQRDGLILFTGSSSIKMWKDLAQYFPDHEVINAGFGGSQTFELLHFVDELIIDYKPSKVFIYEGDNDISSGKSSTEIMLTMHELVSAVHEALPETEILLISAKPSISRWHLKAQYIDFNQHLEEYSQLFDYVEFVDTWDTMLDSEGNPKAGIFLEDKLHMNKAGYDLWAEVVKKYMD
jgi:lysophospholipase L1-like esterase